MKTKEHQRKKRLRIASLCLCLCLLPSMGAGCAKKEDNTLPPESDSTQGTTAGTDSSEPQTQAPTPDAQTDPLRSYYEGLIADLKATLLEEQADRYITNQEYEAKLAELQATLEALTKEDVPTDAEPVDPPETDKPGTPTDSPPAEDGTATVSFRYEIVDGYAIIHEYLGGARAVSIPADINGVPVRKIADSAFKNTNITSVVIPNSVNEIGWFAFAGCYTLESVTVPSSVATINYGAFDGCPYLLFLCSEGSYAAQYALSFGIRRQYIM